jgi:dihydroorotase
MMYGHAEGGSILTLTMRKPFDGHQHVRDGAMLEAVVPMVEERFWGAIIMPNLVPPITTADMARDYATRIGNACKRVDFFPFMTLYLTETLDPNELDKGGGVVGVKFYPQGLTTNSEHGISGSSALWTPGTNAYNVLRKLAENKKVLLIHAADSVDKNGKTLDPFEQEPHFIGESLPRIREAHPTLKISVEHLSTRVGAEYMAANGDEFLGCALTPHHLLANRNDLFKGGFNRNLFWIPILQSADDQAALQELAVADKPFVWLGSDSAPHPLSKKQGQCCPGGVLTAHAAIELYAEAFEKMGALDDRFERFASINGPRFYGFPPSGDTITLVREEWTVSPFTIATEGCEDPIEPFRAGEKILWKLVR